ncbi:MAG TPA: cytochrome c oxidase assembly protein [Geminicoccus sp.]|jgi:cytochrome c oxidase assembly protein subunit 11|uniref:cytochrome c oxidase assembly protein n=1 Tax=Geminicoccus sp. TaxID=2024832 RepID=UPI002E340FCE|nr:cytochrome c oxidase assembly protein [Geminicoccus sp.]HEX2526117.1 cytochrome c oxidase assembly protein [Geminicoccus sp.]
MSASNTRVALACGAIIMGMVGITAASVPLYDLFCKVTGYGGTTQRSETASSTVSDVEVTVSFNADTAPDMPWTFKPAQRSVKVRLGEETLIFYTAENRSKQPVAGTATFNVTPFASGPYFSKLQCFCFEEQVLQPGQTVEMPVSFYVDPAILDDPDARHIREITLSYTFFKDAEETRKLSTKSPDSGPGSSPAPAG